MVARLREFYEDFGFESVVDEDNELGPTISVARAADHHPAGRLPLIPASAALLIEYGTIGARAPAFLPHLRAVKNAAAYIIYF